MPVDWNTFKPDLSSKEAQYVEKERKKNTQPEYDMIQRSSKKNGKSKLKKELKGKIQKQINKIESINIPKIKKSKTIPKMLEIAEMIVKAPKTKKINTKNISNMMDIAEMIVKIPKTKKIQYSKEIDDSIAEIDKLLKAPKKEVKKIMKQSEGYVHKVNNISPAVQNYVSQYKAIINEGKSQGVTTKNINKLKLDVMTSMKPSDISDATKLISDYRKTIPTKEKKTYVKKVKAEKPVDNSYKGDKKYKPYTVYVMKHKPHMTDPEDIHLIVSELIDKKPPRLSVKILNKAMEDAGFDEKDINGSGFKNHYDDSDTSSGSSSDYE